MGIKWGRDYHTPRSGTMTSRGPDTSRCSPGEAHPPGGSPCRFVEAVYPVSFHLSIRPFGSDRGSDLRPHCGMAAEFTENLTLSRAHARGDSPLPLKGRSLDAPWEPAICLLRMRLAALQRVMHRMAYAIREVFRCGCTTY